MKTISSNVNQDTSLISPASLSLSSEHTLQITSIVAATHPISVSKPTTPYCKYALVRFGSVAGVALIDSGNTWRTVISPEFAIKLGINLKTDLRPIRPSCTIGTAKSGQNLNILGETKTKLHLSFGNSVTKFQLRPVVVENLSMSINISGPFLKRHNIDQIHSRDCLQVQQQQIPLYSSLQHVEQSEVTESKIFLLGSHTIPPNSYIHCSAIVTQIAENRMPATDGAIVGSIDFMSKHDCHPWINALVTPNHKGEITVGIMNTQPYPIEIPDNSLYGDFKLICTTSEESRYPWRISVLSKQQTSHDSKLLKPTTYKEKLSFLLKTFKLDQCEYLKQPKDLTKALHILLKYWDTFSFDGSFGATTLLQHQIYTEDRPPINLRYRPINPNLEPHLKQQIDDWLKHDVIEPSSSPYNFPLVCVPKKNGKYRWCIDYRELNKISKRDTYPIGNIEDNLARLANSKIFSGLDGSGAFHVVPLTNDSKEKTAFSTPFGLYQFKRLPFGLANGPSTYARLIKMVLSHIPTSIAIPYLDDTIIHSPTLDLHFRDLQQVLEAHKQAGLKLQPSKCQLFQKSIDYLGHRVSAQGIAPLKSHTDIIKTWPMPTNRNEIRSFLGKVGYYRRFIKNFAGIAKPLTDKLSKDGTDDKALISTTPEIATAFHSLRNSLLNAPILAYPQFKSQYPFILDTDWSYDNAAIGAVLLQQQDGLERVIAYGAHKLAKSQRNYPPTKGELFAVVYFVNHYKYYLAHRPFIIRTDHQALKYMAKMEPPTGLISRWMALLANYDFTVQHRAGKKHQNADALSRCTHLQQNEADHSTLADEVVCSLQETQVWNAKFLSHAQLNDSDIAYLFPLLRNKQKVVPDHIFVSLTQTGRLYANLFNSLTLDQHNIIRYTLPRSDNPFSNPRKVYLLPQKLIKEAIFRTHKQIAHLAALATFNRLRLYAFFPNMYRTIKETLLMCSPCQTKTVRLPDQHHTLKSKISGFPFQTLSLDFVGPFPPSFPHKQIYLFTIKDTFTKWIEAFPLKKATSQEVIQILENEIFSRFGKCEHIHTDQGTQFTSHEMKAYCNLHKIKLTHTPAYNPKSNPVERVHREIKAALVALSSQKPSSWASYIPSILYALRIMKNRSTTFTPFQLMYGREPIDDLDVLYYHPRHETENWDLPEYVSKLRERLTQAYHLARTNMNLAVERQRRSYYRKKTIYEEGQKVWLFTPILGSRQTTKLHTGWSGPWQIARRINDVTYEIHTNAFPHPKKEVVSIDRLRRCFEDEEKQVLPPLDGQSLQMNEDFFVQSPGEIELEKERKPKHPPIDYIVDGSDTAPVTDTKSNNPLKPTAQLNKTSLRLPLPQSTSQTANKINSSSSSPSSSSLNTKTKTYEQPNTDPNSTYTLPNTTYNIPNEKSRIFNEYSKQFQPTTPENSPILDSPEHSILYEPYSQYLDWSSPQHFANWTLDADKSKMNIVSSTPEPNLTKKIFGKEILPPNSAGKFDKNTTEHNRRVRYELRTGASRDDTLEGMKTTKTPPPSPVTPREEDLQNPVSSKEEDLQNPVSSKDEDLQKEID